MSQMHRDRAGNPGRTGTIRVFDEWKLRWKYIRVTWFEYPGWMR